MRTRIVLTLSALSAGMAFAGQRNSSAPLKLSSGTRVTFLAVGDEEKRSWSATGRRLPWVHPSGLMGVPGMSLGPKSDGLRSLIWLVQLSGTREQPSVTYRFPDASTPASSFVTPDQPRRGFLVGLVKSFKAGTPFTDLSLGIAEGAWTVRGWSRHGSKAAQGGIAFGPKVSGQAGMGPANSVSVKVRLPRQLANHAVRVVAFDRRGRRLPEEGSAIPPGTTLPNEFWFRGSAKDLARLELQARPYHWLKFNRIRLSPLP